MTENSFSDGEWFLDNVADYIRDITEAERKEDIKWLRSVLKDNHITWNMKNRSFVLHEGFREAFFEPYLQKFKTALHNIDAIVNIVSFAKLFDRPFYDLSNEMYRLNEAFDDERGFYFVSDEDGVQTMHEFLRYAEYDKPYYIGGILDYHS